MYVIKTLISVLSTKIKIFKYQEAGIVVCRVGEGWRGAGRLRYSEYVYDVIIKSKPCKLVHVNCNYY